MSVIANEDLVDELMALQVQREFSTGGGATMSDLPARLRDFSPEFHESCPEALEAAGAIEYLQSLLAEAIFCIKVFHGREGWDIYYNESPEMKRFLAALPESKGGTGDE